MNKKECKDCGVEKSLDMYYRHPNAKDGRRAKCKECEKAWENSPDTKSMTASRRRARQLNQYGISPAQYENWLIKQHGLCAICKKPEQTIGLDGTPRLLCVDHDHSCCPGRRSCGLCVRGLVCTKCNQALGLFNDDPEIIESAIKYLTGV